MATNLLFVFRINEDGSQTTLVKAEVDHTVSWEELVQWGQDNLPGDCGRFQIDAVNQETVNAQFPGSPDYAALQWGLWQANTVGSPAIENLGGTYTNAVLTVKECETPPTSTTTQQVTSTTSTSTTQQVTTTTTTVAPTAPTTTAAPAPTVTTQAVDAAPTQAVDIAHDCVWDSISSRFHAANGEYMLNSQCGVATREAFPVTGVTDAGPLAIIAILVIILGAACLATARKVWGRA
jgi:hypothetical protein